MLDARTADRIRVFLSGIPGSQGFALALSFENKIEIILGGVVNPAASAKGIVDTAEQHLKAVTEEPPIWIN